MKQEKNAFSEQAAKGRLPARRVLVVEDDEGLNRLARKALDGAGFETLGAMTGAEALERIASDSGLVVLLDQKLPDMSGTDVIRALMDQGLKVPFIAMTGHGNEKTAVEMMKLGARDYLVKGFELTRMLPEVLLRVFRELETEQRLARAEAELHRREKRYKVLFNSGNDAAFVYPLTDGAPGAFVEVNDVACARLGYSREELLRLSPAQIHLPGMADERRRIFQEILKNGRFVFEMIHVGKSGQRIPVEISSRLFEIDGESYVLSIARDVTERRLAAEAMRESEERMDLVLRGADLASWDWNVATGDLAFNERWAEMLGYSHDDLASRLSEWEKRVHPDDLPGVMEALNAHLENKTGFFEAEYRLRHRYGDWIWVLDKGRVIERGEDGAPLRACGTHADVTARKRTEKEIANQAANLNAIFNSTPNILMLVNSEGRVEKINHKGIVFSRKREPEILGQLGGEIFNCLNAFDGRGCGRNPDCTWCPIRSRVESTFATGLPHHEEEGRKAFLLNGKESEVDFLISTILLEVNGAPKVLLSLTDISDRKRQELEKARLEEQYRQARKMDSIGRLAGGVAHDLNNLLSPILGYGEMLLEDTMDDDPRREGIQEIVQAAIRARDLVRRLLAFSRKQTLAFKPVDINTLLRNFEKLLRRTIREDVDLLLTLNPALPSVAGDVGQLEQVVMNLAVNAQDAMPDGGSLNIETASVELAESEAALLEDLSPGPHVLLTVRDTGSGMDEETREHLFEPFYTTKGIDKGTGLGLATVYGIVKQHGGAVVAESEPGRGSRFTIYLPASEGAAKEGHAAAEAPQVRGGKETILLVEDNEQVRKFALSLLRRRGYTVLAAASGIEALDVLAGHQGPVHLLLTDVVMPAMNGKQLFEQVSAGFPDIRVLYMSGYPGEVIAQRGVMDAGVHYIQKPFSVQALTAKIREVLER